MTLKHAFTSSVADGADATLVRPSNWNADHVLSSGDTRVLFNDATAIGQDAALTFNKTTPQLRVGPAESTLDAWLQNSVVGAVHVVGTQNQYDVGLGVEMQGPDVYGLFFTTLGKGGSTASYGIAASAVAGAAATPRVVAVAASAGSNASGAATDAIALLADGGVLVAGGSITNQYGLKIDDQAKGSNNWAIHTSAGNVRFGTLTASQLVLTDASKNLISSAVGTGVTTALAVNVGSAGAFVTFNGALGTPSSGTLTNCTGLPIAGLVASTSTAIGVGTIELGAASDTTIARSGAGAITVEGVQVILSGAALGTPSSGTLTNCTALPVAGITASTSTALGVGSVELGHATDTTLTRVSAGVLAVEGVNVETTATLANTKIAVISFVIDGGGATITTGVKGDLEIPFACTINRATLLADQSGSIVVDIWKDTYANYPPTVADTITASAKPTITTATKAQDATLTGWTTSVAAGDTLRFNVDSITTCQRVLVALKVTKT